MTTPAEQAAAVLAERMGCGPGEMLTGPDYETGEETAIGQMCRSSAHTHAYWGPGCEFAHDLVERLAASNLLTPTPEAVAQARAEELRSTADVWTQGAWSDVMLPKPTPPAVPVIAYSNRVGDWLRYRADRIASDGGEQP